MPLLAKRLREMAGKPRKEMKGLIDGYDNPKILEDAMGLMKERLGRGSGEEKK